MIAQKYARNFNKNLWDWYKNGKTTLELYIQVRNLNNDYL